MSYGNMIELALLTALLVGTPSPAAFPPVADDRIELYSDTDRYAADGLLGDGVRVQLRRWGVDLDAGLEPADATAPGPATPTISLLTPSARDASGRQPGSSGETHAAASVPSVPELDVAPMSLRNRAEIWSDGTGSFVDLPKELVLSLSRTRVSRFSLRVRSVTRFTSADPNQADAPSNGALSTLAMGVGWEGWFGEIRLYACYTDSLNVPLVDRDMFYRDEADRRVNAIVEWRIALQPANVNVHIEMFEGMDVSEWGASWGILIERP